MQSLFDFILLGYTEDYHEMLCDLVKKYPQTKIVAIGYSLGGNLVAKYMGEDRTRPPNIVAAVSVCQGYNAIEYVLSICIIMNSVSVKRLIHYQWHLSIVTAMFSSILPLAVSRH